MLLPLPLFQRKVCASLSALGEVQLLEAITFPPGEGRGHFARIVCHQINKEHACPSTASWNVWGDMWSIFFQLNLSFPLIPELVQVLTNKWWWSGSPAALLRWTDMKNKTRCGKFQSAFLQVLPDQLVVCPDHYSCCDNSAPESSYLNFWFCFFCESCEYDFALLSNRQKAKYCIHVMSDSAFSSFSISTLKQCALCF